MSRTRVLVLVCAMSAASVAIAQSNDRSVAAGATVASPHTREVVTRKQVRAELEEAYRLGLLHANPNQYPSEYVAYARDRIHQLARDGTPVNPKARVE
jgi:hypothetical protein